MSSETPTSNDSPENVEAGGNVEPGREMADNGGPNQPGERIDRLESIISEQTVTISALVTEIQETNRWLKRLVTEKSPAAMERSIELEDAGPSNDLEKEAGSHKPSRTPSDDGGEEDDEGDDSEDSELIGLALQREWEGYIVNTQDTEVLTKMWHDWFVRALAPADADDGDCSVVLHAPEFQELLGTSRIEVGWLPQGFFIGHKDHKGFKDKTIDLMKAHIEKVWPGEAAAILTPQDFKVDDDDDDDQGARWVLHRNDISSAEATMTCCLLFRDSQDTAGGQRGLIGSFHPLDGDGDLLNPRVGAFWAVGIHKAHIPLALISRLGPCVWGGHRGAPSPITLMFLENLLDNFACKWEDREWAQVMPRFHGNFDTLGVNMGLTRILYTIGVFCPISPYDFNKTPFRPHQPALKCLRESGVLPALDGGILSTAFVERRVCLLFTSDDCDESECTSDDSDRDSQPEENFRVLLLNDGDSSEFERLDFSLRLSVLYVKKRGLKVQGARPGFMLFQTMLLGLLVYWSEQWQSSLNEIDSCVKVKLTNVLDTKTSEDLMFDNSFEASRVYFKALQVLRIFSETIRQSRSELRSLSDLSDFQRKPWVPPSEGVDDDIRTNWNIILDFHAQEELKLLQRIAEKTEEIKSLRDGLFNATSLLEASKSTTMNRYIIVFTIVTVLYLPPSFVATVFGTDLFNSDDTDGTITKFKFTTVAVSLSTYLVAFFLVWLADRMNSVRKLRTYIREKLYRLVLRFRMFPSKVEPGEDQDSEIHLEEDQDSEIQLEEDQDSESRVRSHWWKPRLPHFMTRHRKKQEAEA